MTAEGQERVVPLAREDFSTLPISERQHKVHLADFREPIAPGGSGSAFLASLPNFLGAASLRELVSEIACRHRSQAQVVMAMGAHVVKVGCGPVVMDLLERGVVTALCVNGALAIHDYEIALVGETSENVDETIRDGSFGWVRETPAAFAQAVAMASERGIGLGQALGILAQDLPHARHSLLATCARLGVPLTVHVGLGTDTVHMHPGLDWAQLGRACETDFRLAAAVVCGLDGGVWLNIGSAVVMPEVFLKLVSLARNLGHALPDVVAANMDMVQHYRTSANVIGRPVQKGISIIGHHEINIPLLRMGIVEALAAQA